MSSDSLLPALEAISRDHPDRVLRLRGVVIGDGGDREALEVLMFRGFSSSTTHPTQFDPDQSVLPKGAVIEMGELLTGPLNPEQEKRVAGPMPAQAFKDPNLWS